MDLSILGLFLKPFAGVSFSFYTKKTFQLLSRSKTEYKGTCLDCDLLLISKIKQ